MATLFRSDGWVKSALGIATAGAQVYVCAPQPANVSSLPPSPLATVFSDPLGTVAIAQPIFTDGFGHYDFYAPAGVYTVVIGNAGRVQQVYVDQSVGGIGSGGGIGLIAGALISITGNVIASTLQAGVGVVLNGNVISATGIAVIPGSHIQLIGNVISAVGFVDLTPSSDQTIATNNLLPAALNTTQSLGSAGAPWNAILNNLTVQGAILGNLIPSSNNATLTQSLGTLAAPWVGVFISLNKILHADAFPGADASIKINAAIAALPSTGGTVDARGFGATVQTISVQIAVGGPNKPVVLIVSSQTVFNIMINNAATDAITIDDASALISDSIGTRTGQFILAATASVNSIVANANRTGTQEILYIKGIVVSSLAGAAIASAAIDIQGVFTNTVLQDIFTFDLPTCVLRLRPATANSKNMSDILILNCNLAGGHVATCVPLKIQSAAASSIANILMLGGAVQFQGVGQNLILIDGAGEPLGVVNVRFSGVDFETGSQAPAVDSIKVVDAQGVIFEDLLASGSTNTNLITFSQTAPGLTHDCQVNNVFNAQGWTNTINDTITSRSITETRITKYVVKGLTYDSIVYNQVIGSAATGTVTLYTPAKTGLFRVNYYINVFQAASSSSSTAVTIGWNDDVAHTKAGATLAANTTAQFDQGSIIVFAQAGFAITYSVAYTSVGGTGMQYQFYITIEAL